MITSIFGQSKSFDLDYQRALDTFDANEALEIYESIIKSNDNSDYFWLSILKKGEILYAKGSYITASKLLKDFNFNSPSNLRTEESINLFLKSMESISFGTISFVKKIFLSCSAYSILANESETLTSNCLKNSLFSSIISLINKKAELQR